MSRTPEDDEDDEWESGGKARFLHGVAEIALYVIPVLVVIAVIWLASVFYANR